MTHRFAVVTRPPLNEEVAPRVSALLGLPPYETKLFLRYPLPSILKFASDEAAARNISAEFRSAGLEVDIVPLEGLISLPNPVGPRAVGLTVRGAWFDFEDGRVEVGPDALKLLTVVEYDLRWVAAIGYEFVHHFGETVTQSREVAELLIETNSGPARIRLVPERLDYAGLGPLKRAAVPENWRTLLAELRRRAPALRFDDAPTKTRPRDMTVDGKTIEAQLAQEPEALKKVVGLYGEFYLALKEWQALQGKTPPPTAASGGAIPARPVEPISPSTPSTRSPADRIEETFRPGATLFPYGLWCVAAVIAGILLWGEANAAGDQQPLLRVASLALFVFGPPAFAAQVARYALGHVTVVPDRGLRLPQGRIIGWREISSVEEAGLSFSYDPSPIRFLTESFRAVWALRWHTAIMGVAQVVIIAIMGLLVLALCFIWSVLVPVMIVLSPWQHRVVVRLRSGERLTWRDLIRETRFIHRVKEGMRSAASGATS